MSPGHIQYIPDTDTHRIGQKQFSDLLHRSRFFHGEARTNHDRQQSQDHEKQHSHHDVLGNRRSRIFGPNVQRIQNRKNKRTEVLVHKMSDWTYVFFHRFREPRGASSSYLRFKCFPHTRRNYCGDQRAQSQTYADQGNVQINKYNIHAERHQSVAKEEAESPYHPGSC